MKRKTVSHLYALTPGDRFYFINDPKKQVWQVEEHTIYRFKGMPIKMAVCVNDHQDKQQFKGKRTIVYLRSATDPVPQQ